VRCHHAAVPDTWITPEMAALTGAELGTQTSFPIAASDIRRWAVALYAPTAPPRLFWDEEYAATTRHGGIVAPEEFNPFAWMAASGPPEELESFDAGASGQAVERLLGFEAPATSNVLNGGMEVEYGVRMRPGDVITSVRRHGGYSERTGRLGLMLFTTFDTEWTNQHGEWVKTVHGISIRY